MMSEKTRDTILNHLKEEGVVFRHIEHETIPRTSEEASRVRGTSQEDGVKALILKTSTGKSLLAVIPAHRRIDMKRLKQVMGVKNLSLQSPEEVTALTDCVVGSVPPFGILWNIECIFDKSLLDKDNVVFSAGTREDSVYTPPSTLISINDGMVADISK